jgi:hypothetical protein
VNSEPLNPDPIYISYYFCSRNFLPNQWNYDETFEWVNLENIGNMGSCPWPFL